MKKFMTIILFLMISYDLKSADSNQNIPSIQQLSEYLCNLDPINEDPVLKFLYTDNDFLTYTREQSIAHQLKIKDSDSTKLLKEEFGHAVCSHDVDKVKDMVAIEKYWHNQKNPNSKFSSILLESHGHVTATPLSLSFEDFSATMTELLINLGAQINNIDMQGDHSLMNALFARNYKAMQILIDAGASINHQNFLKQTVLHIISDHIVKPNCNTNINLPNLSITNWSAEIYLNRYQSFNQEQKQHCFQYLFNAAQHQHIINTLAITEILLAAGAQVDLKDYKNMTALDYAHQGIKTTYSDVFASLLQSAHDKQCKKRHKHHLYKVHEEIKRK